MKSEIARGLIKENSDTQYISYVLENSDFFYITGFKVLQSQEQNGYIKCSKLSHNGKIKLVYDVSSYSSLESILPSINTNIFTNILIKIISAINEVKNNGFIQPENIAISFDKVFVDVSNYKVYLIYLPINSNDSSYNIAEELGGNINMAICRYPRLSASFLTKLVSDIKTNNINIETVYKILSDSIASETRTNSNLSKINDNNPMNQQWNNKTDVYGVQNNINQATSGFNNQQYNNNQSSYNSQQSMQTNTYSQQQGMQTNTYSQSQNTNQYSEGTSNFNSTNNSSQNGYVASQYENNNLSSSASNNQGNNSRTNSASNTKSETRQSGNNGLVKGLIVGAIQIVSLILIVLAVAVDFIDVVKYVLIAVTAVIDIVASTLIIVFAFKKKDKKKTKKNNKTVSNNAANSSSNSYFTPVSEDSNTQLLDDIVVGDMCLVGMNTPEKVEIRIGKGEFYIGKSPENDAEISFNKAISRRHCKIVFKNGEYYICDAGSSNGTYVNGMRCSQDLVKIGKGDIIKLANSDFMFKQIS